MPSHPLSLASHFVALARCEQHLANLYKRTDFPTMAEKARANRDAYIKLARSWYDQPCR